MKNSEQSWINYAERIFALLKVNRKEFSEYSLEKSRQLGFTGPQLFVVFTLCKNPGINLQELSERMELSKSTVSGIVDRLVIQGDVLREIPTENRRSVKLFLSPDFLKKCDLMETKKQYLTDLIHGAEPEELELIIQGLEKLSELIRRNKCVREEETKPEIK
ncbi:MarR family winged helix-turn-helix transcriptional regulator [Clostridium aminobutyricum]|uniref:MarR family transcriptional regulator n=1 Tax=Clostridium aminobutyricum TaxID=33953 RepID=A0A939DA80_CLOAM|nr:MarR family transcriptional regulator [Clostridium aminobutyricum]MBN7773985.1 MarR family transcriptional regulator [Clostridium aminobutyricum]